MCGFGFHLLVCHRADGVGSVMGGIVTSHTLVYNVERRREVFYGYVVGRLRLRTRQLSSATKGRGAERFGHCVGIRKELYKYNIRKKDVKQPLGVNASSQYGDVYGSGCADDKFSRLAELRDERSYLGGLGTR